MSELHVYFEQVVSLVQCPPYTLRVVERGYEYFLQAEYFEPDSADPTGPPRLQKTRKWLLSPHATKSEIVQTALKCILTSAEHAVREHFHYRGKRVFGPHYDVDALWDVCDRTEVRS